MPYLCGVWRFANAYTYERIRGNTVSLTTLLKIVLYSYMNEDYSSRSMELNCKRDINFMFLLEGMDERTKILQVAKTFLKYRQKDVKRILSDDGIVFRTNRSIQAEGSFRDIKQDMQFRRYLSRGTKNVLAESTFLVMARNINKLHNQIQKGRTGIHLFPRKSA